MFKDFIQLYTYDFIEYNISLPTCRHYYYLSKTTNHTCNNIIIIIITIIMIITFICVLLLSLLLLLWLYSDVARTGSDALTLTGIWSTGFLDYTLP